MNNQVCGTCAYWLYDKKNDDYFCECPYGEPLEPSFEEGNEREDGTCDYWRKRNET